jgi:heptaprenyl diphosphate synthase
MSYVDLHRQVSLAVEAEITTALAGLGPRTPAVTDTVAALLRHQKMKHPLSVLPLLVHGAETGEHARAVPLAAVHLLWWTSACYLDDLADGHGTGGVNRDEALLASVITGNALPLRIVGAQPVPDAVRGALAAEIAEGWISAVEGQLRDMRGEAVDAAPGTVRETYRGKSGAPFSMITAMAAILAGAPHGHTALWREFGEVFGVLWQLFNDQEDIATGRDEDLRNGTVTYLLACALDEATPEERGHLLDLWDAARESELARTRLTRLLCSSAVLHRYREDIETLRARAYAVLGELGGDERYLPMLRQIVDLAAQPLVHGVPEQAGAVPAAAVTAGGSRAPLRA